MGTKLTDEQVNNILKKNGEATTEELKELEVSFDDIDQFGDKSSLKEVYTDIASYNRMIRERMTFINDPLTTAIPFTRENLYLICAYSGNGKSTIAANISYPLWKQNKKVLVIANEEPKQDVLFRIGCLEKNLNFNDYKKGRMPIDVQTDVAKLFPDIMQYVKVLDVNFKEGFTTKVEGVMNAMNAVIDKDYSCILIDYYQLIKFSKQRPNAKPYEVLNDFRIWLGQFIKRCDIPVVVFAQLHSLGKRANKDLDSRIKHCPDIYEPSTVVIEVVPNFNDQTSDFMIHKDRFGYAGQKVTCGFDHGRYVKLSDDFRDKIAEKKRVAAEKRLDELEGKTTPQEDTDDES